MQKDNNFIDDVLKVGSEKAGAIASEKVKKMKEILGF